MIESAMFFGLGFFVACLVTIFVANAVWRRAVRLTTKRVQAAMPVSLAEIKADRDQLRAEFAMSTRRLEILVDELKQKSQAQLIDVAKKNDQLRLVLGELKDRTEAMRAQEEREKTLKDEVLAAEARHGDTLRSLRQAEEKLVEANRALGEREKALAELNQVSDGRRVEIAALQTNVARFEEEVADLKRALANAEEDKAGKQERLVAAETALAEARAKVAAMQSQLTAAEETSRSQAEEVGRLQAKIVEQSSQLTGQIAETERMASRVQQLLTERDKLDEELTRRTAEAEMRARSLLDELQTFRSDKAALEGQLAAERTTREKLQTDFKSLEGAASENWERERVENALLRERINDLAAEVTAMTAALEGDGSAIGKLIAEAEKGVRLGQAAPTASGASVATKPDDPRRVSLAERVRALQARVSVNG
jgi:DNA repair exonuclease SbcCD ATPase subunit